MSRRLPCWLSTHKLYADICAADLNYGEHGRKSEETYIIIKKKYENNEKYIKGKKIIRIYNVVVLDARVRYTYTYCFTSSAIYRKRRRLPKKSLTYVCRRRERGM